MTDRRPERQFIHDIMNPLTIGLGSLERALQEATGLDETHPKLLELMDRSRRALRNVAEVVHQRREEIKCQDAPTKTKKRAWFWRTSV